MKRLILNIKEYIENWDFYPNLLCIFSNPFYLTRRALLENMMYFSENHTFSGKILDVGCGKKPYRRLFPNTTFVGLEIDTPENRKNKAADFFYNGTVFPFGEKEFDHVLCNEVLEHVADPLPFLNEIRRVMKPSGTILITCPFVWAEHEAPYDFWRFSTYATKLLLEKSGFTIIESKTTCNDIRAPMQMLAWYLFDTFISRFHHGKLPLVACLIAPVTILGIIGSKLLPANQSFFLDNVILAEKEQ
ncbi:MAG: class I SAM-dependent methyltransferase [Candidatus Riflebacteria bacterium]|nr:class I SAM-dependent methyltransferase [Candidatus Riflebacteria bacterium]